MNIDEDTHGPRIGDLIGCVDGDLGIVLWEGFDDDTCLYTVKVAWNSQLHAPLTDPWDSEDFQTADDLFHIMSRV